MTESSMQPIVGKAHYVHQIQALFKDKSFHLDPVPSTYHDVSKAIAAVAEEIQDGRFTEKVSHKYYVTTFGAFEHNSLDRALVGLGLQIGPCMGLPPPLDNVILVRFHRRKFLKTTLSL